MSKKLLINSIIIALTISLITPFIWLFFEVPTHQVVELDDPKFDNMTRDEISEWIDNNVPPPTVWEHCKYLAGHELWRSEYVKYACLLFILLFLFSISFGVISKRKNP